MSGFLDPAGGEPMAPEPADPFAMEPDDGRPLVRREAPEPDAARAARVRKWLDDIADAKRRWMASFDRMREDMAFVYGKQWPELRQDPDTKAGALAWTFGDRYVLNICQRHVAQRVAALYARNPKPSVKPRDRVMSSVWDGTPQHAMQAAARLAAAQQQAMMAQAQADQMGMMAAPPPVDVEAQTIVQEFQAALQHRQQVTRFSRTLELLLQYYMGEQAVPFKRQMKSAVRRGVTCGVAWIKVGLHRQMEMRPDAEAKINDLSNRLAALERLSADVADGEAPEDSAEADALRSAIESLKAEPEVVVSEGLTFDFPRATAIIPSRDCVSLPGFIGASWVAEEYVMTAERIIEVYGIDPRHGANEYRGAEDYQAGTPPRMRSPDGVGKNGEDETKTIYRVYEVFCQADGTSFHLLEGYPDFLREPAPPERLLERFWPWYALTFNEVESDEELFPPSDVRLMRSMQVEINRAREGLKEHRRANRPKVAARKDALSDEDVETLTQHPDDGVALLELDALDDGQKISDVLQKVEMPGIDPNLYDISPQMDDVMRVVGSQEANLGPATSKSTATETAISESSRMSALSAAVDELDDTLSEVCRGAAQMCLSELTEETVKEIVGPGALWPQLSREEIAREILVAVEAGSTGRPNKAARVADFQSVAPFLIQTPGIRPDKLAMYQLTLLDTGMDLSDFLDPALPSIAAMNAMSKGPAMGAGSGEPSREDPGKNPENQGGEGGDNTARPKDPEAGGVPNVPQAGGFGMARQFMPPA